MYNKLAQIMASMLTNNQEMERIARLKLIYGLEVLISNAVSMAIILTFAWIFRCLSEFAVVFLSFKACRTYAHGVHAKSHIHCVFASTVILVFVPVLAHYWILKQWTVVAIGLWNIIMIACYAPADTEKNPIIGRENREHLRKQAIATASLLVVIAWLVPIPWVKFCVLYGLTMESLSVLPITYILLKKRRNNYGRYEAQTH